MEKNQQGLVIGEFGGGRETLVGAGDEAGAGARVGGSDEDDTGVGGSELGRTRRRGKVGCGWVTGRWIVRFMMGRSAERLVGRGGTESTTCPQFVASRMQASNGLYRRVSGRSLALRETWHATRAGAENKVQQPRHCLVRSTAGGTHISIEDRVFSVSLCLKCLHVSRLCDDRLTTSEISAIRSELRDIAIASMFRYRTSTGLLTTLG